MHGIIQAGFPARPLEDVQVASIQTLHRRAIHAETMDLPPADLLVIDEAHHCPANTYRKIIASYPEAILLGLTATPCRGDGRGLGGIFETIIECPQVAALIEQGFLVKTRVYAPINPDLTGVRTVAGDYVESQLADRMDRPKLIGDIVTHWHKFGERRKTVAFTVNVSHSVHLRDEFIKSGVRAEHIDGSTPKPERDASLARLASGEIELVTNCMVLTEGWDMPEVGCCILARPTKKMGLFRQMIGRVLRPADGKTDAIVLDHSGAVLRHGFVEDPVEWTLDPDRRAESPAHAARCEHYASRLLECSQCGAVRIAGEPCGHCGFLPQRPPRSIRFEDGDLAEVGRDRRIKPQSLRSRATQPMARDAGAYRRRARLQARMERAQVQGKIRRLAALGRTATAHRTNTRGPLVGALAADCLREVEERGMKAPRKNRISGQWSPRPIKMLESPAYRALSLSAHRIMSRIEIELARHGGKDNGRLPVTKRDFIAYGMQHVAVANGIREAEALGFIQVTERGRGGNSEHHSPNLFRLTFVQCTPIQARRPTNGARSRQSRRLSQSLRPLALPKAEAVAMGKRAARKNKTRSRKPDWGRSRKPGPKKLIFGPGNQDQQAQIPGPGNQDYYLDI